MSEGFTLIAALLLVFSCASWLIWEMREHNRIRRRVRDLEREVERLEELNREWK